MRKSADVTFAIRKVETIRRLVLAALRNFDRMDLEPTAQELAYAVGHPLAAATVTAKLRELRKPQYGSHAISCRRCPEEEHGNGYVYRYRISEARW